MHVWQRVQEQQTDWSEEWLAPSARRRYKVCLKLHSCTRSTSAWCPTCPYGQRTVLPGRQSRMIAPRDSRPQLNTNINKRIFNYRMLLFYSQPPLWLFVQLAHLSTNCAIFKLGPLKNSWGLIEHGFLQTRCHSCDSTRHQHGKTNCPNPHDFFNNHPVPVDISPSASCPIISSHPHPHQIFSRLRNQHLSL